MNSNSNGPNDIELEFKVNIQIQAFAHFFIRRNCNLQGSKFPFQFYQNEAQVRLFTIQAHHCLPLVLIDNLTLFLELQL